MRDATFFPFGFWYTTAKGKRNRLFPRKGSVAPEGIYLEDDLILLEDIDRIDTYGKFVIINLMPYIATGKKVSDRLYQRHNSLILRMPKKFDAFSLKASVDRTKGVRTINERMKGMTKEEIKEKLKKRSCPHCDSVIDLTDEPEAPYIYCQYCEGIFDKHGYETPGMENYRICPECNYFGKVGRYVDYDFYITQKHRKFGKKTYYCCDTCVNRKFFGTLLRNIPLVVGALAMIYAKIKATHRRHPAFDQLEGANKAAQDREFGEARNLYDRILVRLHEHPGILYNMGLMHLFANNPEPARGYFERALKSCPTYLPVYNIMEKYRYFTPVEERAGGSSEEDEHSEDED